MNRTWTNTCAALAEIGLTLVDIRNQILELILGSPLEANQSLRLTRRCLARFDCVTMVFNPACLERATGLCRSARRCACHCELACLLSGCGRCLGTGDRKVTCTPSMTRARFCVILATRKLLIGPKWKGSPRMLAPR